MVLCIYSKGDGTPSTTKEQTMWGNLTAWCQNPECREEFALTESCDGEFCSWDCAERAAELEDLEV